MPKSVNLPDTGGRRIEPTAADIKRIEGWQADGVGLVHMARALRISVETLRAWRERHPDVKLALEAGKETEHLALRNKAFDMAMNGNPIMVMFLLKTRHGYREGEVLQQGNRLNITFNLPGARKLEPVTIEANGTDTRAERLPTTRT